MFFRVSLRFYLQIYFSVSLRVLFTGSSGFKFGFHVGIQSEFFSVSLGISLGRHLGFHSKFR